MGDIQWSFIYISFPLKVVSYIWREFVSNIYYLRGRRGRDSIVVGFPTTCAISVYHYQSCEFEPCLCRGVLDATLCDKAGQ